MAKKTHGGLHFRVWILVSIVRRIVRQSRSNQNRSVIVVSIGRLVSLASAGSGLLDDLTWTTIPYIMWVQCEGPISVMSVSLPNIVHLLKLLREKDLSSHSTNISPGISNNRKSIDSRNFIRLEPIRSKDLGNDTSISSQPEHSGALGEEVSITREVNVTAHYRIEI